MTGNIRDNCYPSLRVIVMHYVVK